MKRLRIAPAVTLAMLLCACGGGGGGVDSTPTPTPTPTPAATNDDLIKPLVSETFTSDSTRATGTFTANSTAVSTATGNLQIAYNSGNGTYSLTGGGISQNFGAGQLDAASSTAEADVYQRTNANTTDVLTLTKNDTAPGTPNNPKFQYVGGGLWERTVDNTTAVTGTIQGFAYGVETPDATLPRTGSADYEVIVRGAGTFAYTIAAARGNGTLTANFATGAITGGGTLDVLEPNGGLLWQPGWSTSAQISATSNSFTGNFGIDMITIPPTNWTGTLAGRFYGPQAKELGAAWSLADGQGTAMSGYLLGKDSSLLPTNTDLAHLVIDEDFASYGWVYQQYKDTTTGEYFGLGEPDPHPGRTPSIRYSEAGPGYALNPFTIDGEIMLDAAHRVAAQSDATFDVYTVTRNDISGLQPRIYTVKVLKAGAGNPLIALKYTSFAQWTRSEVDHAPYAFVDEGYIAFGRPTPASAIPVTGTGTYSALIFGQTNVANNFTIMDVRGDAQLIFDFGAGSLGGYMHPLAISRSDGTQYDLGQYDFAQTIFGVGSTAFSGEFANYLGSGTDSYFEGQFMGPNAQEIAARWASLYSIPSIGVGGKIFGIWVGKDPTR